MAVIQNIFKKLEFKLSMQDEIKLYRWSQKPIKEKLAQLVEWNEELTPEHILVKAAEQILEQNYPNEYLKYAAMQQKFKHEFPFYIEQRISDVGGLIEWLNSIFAKFEGLQEGLLGGLVISPNIDGVIVSCEYEKGILQRVLNKGDGEDAELLVNLMDLESIPDEIPSKKRTIIRGVITLKDITKKPKNVNLNAYINKIIFDEEANDDNLIFIPYELIPSDKKFKNTSKTYQTFKDYGFVLTNQFKASTVIELLDKYEEFNNIDFGFEVDGYRIEIENSNTINELIEIMKEDNLSEYLHKIILE